MIIRFILKLPICMYLPIGHVSISKHCERKNIYMYRQNRVLRASNTSTLFFSCIKYTQAHFVHLEAIFAELSRCNTL